MIPVPRSIARIPILRGLYRIALNGYARLSRGRYTVEDRMGLRLLLDLDNVVDQQVFVSGTWEKGTIDTLLSLAREERQRHGGEAVFVDIGAHWGLYALLARQSGMFDRIVAFEPDPTNYGQLQANLFLNDAAAAIEALQLATSDRERTFGLSLATRRNRGGTHVVEVAQVNQVTCRAVRVDQQLDITDKLLVIKMDVEGHEMEAIDGLVGLLAKNRCILQVEIWSTPEEEMPRRLALLETLFARYGIKFVRAIITDHFFVSEPRA
jgi:FkbM family methyltransferase